MVQLGMSQQILTILQPMYSKAMSRVKLSNGDVTDSSVVKSIRVFTINTQSVAFLFLRKPNSISGKS